VRASDRAPTTSWLDAANAYLAREYGRAADLCAAIGALPEEAFFRIDAAQAAHDDGDQVEAADQLDRALDFYRRVGAASALRRAEGVVPLSVALDR
jgi:thioredoxin-like negative regulator of GroEL